MQDRNGFMLANDLIWMHTYRGGTADRLRPRTGVKKPYRSLPSAIFILSFAAAEEHVKEAALNAGIYKGDKRKNGTMHMGNEGFIKKWKEKTDMDLAARIRSAPRGKRNIHDWEIIEGNELDKYLRQCYRWRNILAHNGTPDKLTQEDKNIITSRFFRKEERTSKGRITLADPSINLNIAEGILQAMQDVAYLTSPKREKRDWKWSVPRWSSTGATPDHIAFDQRFPLPKELFEWARDRNSVDHNGWN